MIIRDFGFASYLIMLGYDYNTRNGVLDIDISREVFNEHIKVYKDQYAKKDKILRCLLRELKNN